MAAASRLADNRAEPMQIARHTHEGPDGTEPRIIVAADATPDRWVDVRVAERLRHERAGATPAAARRMATAVAPASLTAALETGDAFLDAARAATATDDDAALAPAGARFLVPVDPPAYRDFMAFAQHFETLAGKRGTAPPDVLYELPVSYLGSVQALLGPDDEIPWPAYSSQIDYELEIGIVVGRGGRNLTPDTAEAHILGITVFNDFSARDIQRREMAGGLGPSKGKHFASAAGPRIVTLDALDPLGLVMRATINGETWTEATSEAMLWSPAELVAWASTGENLAAGTLLGSGTVGGGCGWELDRYLEPGDVVELEIEGIGVLRNRIAVDESSGWRPPSRGADRSS